MTPPPPQLPSDPSSSRWLILLPFALAASLFLLCRILTTGLPLYFSTFAILILILPPSTLAQSTLYRKALCAGGLVDILALLLLPSLISSQITLTQWLLFYLLLTTFAASLFGSVLLLDALHLPPPLNSALTVLFFLAWLTWPLWTSSFLTSPAIADWIIPPHPLFAANSLLHPPFGIWTEQPFAYRLTTLNQDLPYSLPQTLLPALSTHTLFAALTLTAAYLLHPHLPPAAPPRGNL